MASADLPELESLDSDTSGYPLSIFVEQPPYDLICDLCLNVVRQPLQSPCCGKTRCSTCIEQLMLHHSESTSPPCPYCRAQLLTFSDKRTELQVNTLRVYCTNKHLGCRWTGELCNVQSHVKSSSGCQYVMVLCTNGCGEMCLRGKLGDHLRHQCHLRKATCIYCQKEDVLEVIVNSHYGKCPEYPLHCPHNCSDSTIMRKDLPAHLKDECPLHVMECPYNQVGCDVMLRRKDMPAHLATNLQHHLNCSHETIQSLQLQVRALQNRLQHRDGDIKYLLKRYVPKSWSEELWKKCRETTLPNPKPPFTFRLGHFRELKSSQVSWTSPFVDFKAKKLSLTLGFQADQTISFAICLMNARMDPAELQRAIYQMRLNHLSTSSNPTEEEDSNHQHSHLEGVVLKFQVRIMNQRSNMMHYTSKVGEIVYHEEIDDDSDEELGAMNDDIQVVHLSQIPIAKVQKEGHAQYIQDDCIYLELTAL